MRIWSHKVSILIAINFFFISIQNKVKVRIQRIKRTYTKHRGNVFIIMGDIVISKILAGYAVHK